MHTNARRVAALCFLTTLIDVRIGAARPIEQTRLTTNLRGVYSRGSLTPQQCSGKISKELRGAYTNPLWNRRFS
jgi:hypothetical protein